MTFEQFQATRKRVDDIRAFFPDLDFGDGGPFPGLVYCDSLVIEEAYGQFQDKYHLVIANSEKLSDDLEPLERDLYDYAVAEGFAD